MTAQNEQLAKVLVVDDSSTVLRVIEGVLVQAGYQVWCTDDGREVVDLAKQAGPELILVDFAMPGMSGFEVCRALGQHSDLENIPIVIMSTRGDPVGDRFVREMGIVDHITKPFAPEALLALVEHTLEKNRSRGKGKLRRRDTGSFRGSKFSPHERRLAALLARASDGAVTADQLLSRLRDALNAQEWLRELREAMRAAPGHPALSGDLGQCGLAEILQMLSLQRQTGLLNVRHDLTRLTIAFFEGSVRLVTGEQIPEELMLGNILVRLGKLDISELEQLLSNRRGTSRRLGAQVVKLGYVERNELHQAMRIQSSELVYELLRWGKGTFEFQRTTELAHDVLEFEFDLTIDELLMEGFRRVDEWGLIESALPSFDVIVRRIPGGLENLGPRGLTEEEEEVLAEVDDLRSVRQVVDASGKGTFSGARILYRLVSARVVTVR